MYPLLQPISAELLKCAWHQGWKWTHKQPSIIHRISLGSLAHSACLTNIISEISIRTRVCTEDQNIGSKGLLQNIVCKSNSNRSRKQGIKCKAGEEGHLRQMPRSERALKWTGQIYPTGPRWALPTGKSEGFILRMRGALKGRPDQHCRRSTQVTGYKIDQREPRRKAETSQEAGRADQEGTNDGVKSETRTGNEEDESTWKRVWDRDLKIEDYRESETRDLGGSGPEYAGGLLFHWHNEWSHGGADQGMEMGWVWTRYTGDTQDMWLALQAWGTAEWLGLGTLGTRMAGEEATMPGKRAASCW